MKNVKLIFVLLLMVNCTSDLPDVLETTDALNRQSITCLDDLPQVKITNNGTFSFDIIIYGQDYSELHTQNLSTTADSDWLDVSNNDIIIVASNNDVYGQKIQLSLVPCDTIEVEINADNVLIVSGE